MKHLITYATLLLSITISVVSMEIIDDTKIREITDFLYAQEIRANALRNEFSSQALTISPWQALTASSWVYKEDRQGYMQYMPACLIHNNAAIFNGKQKSCQSSVFNPDFFRKSNDNHYSATITTTTYSQDTVTLTTHDQQSIKTKTLFNDRKFTNKLCFNPASTYLIAGTMGDSNILEAWDLATGERCQALTGHKGLISVIEYNHAGSKMLTISHRTVSNTFILWDTSSSYIKPINTIQLAGDFFSQALFSPADDRIFVSSDRGDVIILDGNTGAVIATHPVNSSIKDNQMTTKAIFTPDNQFYITTTGSVQASTTSLLETCTGDKIATLLDCNAFGNCQGVGLMPNNHSVITTFENKCAIITKLVSDEASKVLHYLQHKTTPGEKIALYHIYCAYKNDTPACQFPQSVVDLLPSHSAVRRFIQKHLFWNKNLIQLDDGSQHILESDEIEASNLLLQKKLLRDKTTFELVKKWGYTIKDYDTLEKAPLYVKNINSKQLHLFRKFLNLDPLKWKAQFQELSSEEHNDLFFLASDDGLAVPQLRAQLAEAIALPEIVEQYMQPHIPIKDICNFLRYQIITDNARNKRFTQKTYILPTEMAELQFNNVFGRMMVVPKAVIKKGLYRFSGRIEGSGVILEDKKWCCDVKKKRDHNLIYYITPTITEDERLEAASKKYPVNERILWVTDSNKNVFYKKFIHYAGEWNCLKFSPDGKYLAISIQETTTHPHTIALISLGTQADSFDYKEMTLPIDKKILSLRFNDQSTVLATGTSAGSTNNIITLWDTSEGRQLSSIPVPLGSISNLCFNHCGNRMFVAYQHSSTISNVALFDTTDYAHPMEIASHIIINDAVWAHPYFSDDDAIIIGTLTEGNLMFLDGITGDIINNTEKKDHNSMCRRVASVFNHDTRLLASACIADEGFLCGNTLLWDAQTATVLAELLPGQAGVNGVGFTPDKRHVITAGETKETDFIITTTLFDEDTHKALKWLKNGTSFLQKYALYCAYMAQQEKNSKKKSVPYLLQHALGSLPKEAYNTKEILEKFLHGIC